MLMPLPESDLSLNVICLGASLIEIMKKKSSPILIEDLLKEFLSKDSRRNHSQFFDTLSFLYIFGVIIEKGYVITLANDNKA